VGFGEHRVGLGRLLVWIYGFWGFLSFLGLILFLFGLFICVLVSPLGFVRFSLVVKVKGCGLWVLEKIR